MRKGSLLYDDNAVTRRGSSLDGPRRMSTLSTLPESRRSSTGVAPGGGGSPDRRSSTGKAGDAAAPRRGGKRGSVVGMPGKEAAVALREEEEDNGAGTRPMRHAPRARSARLACMHTSTTTWRAHAPATAPRCTRRARAEEIGYLQIDAEVARKRVWELRGQLSTEAGELMDKVEKDKVEKEIRREQNRYIARVQEIRRLRAGRNKSPGSRPSVADKARRRSSDEWENHKSAVLSTHVEGEVERLNMKAYTNPAAKMCAKLDLLDTITTASVEANGRGDTDGSTSAGSSLASSAEPSQPAAGEGADAKAAGAKADANESTAGGILKGPKAAGAPAGDSKSASFKAKAAAE